MGRPRADAPADRPVVLALLRDQHPDLAERPLRRVAEGWDNVTWRLGDDLAVRLPRHAAADALAAHEQRWLGEVAARLGPGLVPVPVRTGRPGRGYPYRWSIVPWAAGAAADAAPLASAGGTRLGAALRALHVPAPADAPVNPHRGVPLVRRGSPLEGLRRAGARVDDALATVWTAALAAPSPAGRVWIHGDLHARNLVVGAGGTLAAIIDWGDLCAGDPAVDLSCLWTVAGPAVADAVRVAYGPMDDALRARARGWALVFAALLIEAHDEDDPAFAAVGRRTLDRLRSG